MAKFFENNLRPEESFASYNVGEPDDDIFQIKDNEYPDDIEEFVFKEPEIPVIEPVISVIEPVISVIEPQIDEVSSDVDTVDSQQNDSNNIWDSFPEDSDTQLNDIIPTDDGDLLSNQAITPNEIIEEIKSSDLQDDSIEPSVLENNQEIKFEMDDEFKRQLAEQLAGSKAKKIKQEELADVVEDNSVEQTPFVPVDEADNAQFYDLTDFGNDRPSEKGIKPEQQTKIENKNKTEVKEKKKSRLPLIIGLSAAIIVVLLGLAYLIMYYLVPNFYKVDNIAKKDSTKTEHIVVKSDSVKTTEKPKVEKNADKEAPKESEKIAEKETEDDVIARINKQYVKTEEKKVKDITNDASKKVEPKKVIKKEQAKEKEQVKKEKTIEKEKTIIVQEKKKETKKEQKKVVITKETKQTEVLKKEIKILDAVYTIQVYSSPSKEDAMDWVDKLKSKNIQAAISEQMIRDVKWYRVRFGNYSTREEAKAVALRYGFSQSWIDRIK